MGYSSTSITKGLCAMTDTTPRQHDVLTDFLYRWERRWRWQTLVRWLPRVLAVMLISGLLTIGVVFMAQAWANAIVWISLVMLSVLVISGAIILWREKRSLPQAAQYYDREWHLQERLTTALEIQNGRIHANPLNSYQVADALQLAQTIDVRKQLPLAWRGREWLAVAVCAILLAFAFTLLTLLAPAFDSLSADTRQAVDDASDTLKDIAQQIAQDPTLDALTRENLLQSIETNLQALAQPNLTAEEAFAVTSNVQTELQATAETLSQSAQLAEGAFANARDALSNGGENSAQTLGEALSDAQQQVQQGENGQELAQSLDNAAQELLSNNPELAQSLQNAAQSLREGDLEAAQSELQNAQQSAQSAEQQNQSAQQSAQSLQNASQEMNNASSQIAQSEQAQNQSSQSGQNQQQESPQGQQGQSDQTGENQQGQEGNQSSEGQEGQQGQNQQGQESQDGQQGQSSQEGQEGQSQQDGQSPSNGGQPNSEQAQNSQQSGNNNSDSPSNAQAQPSNNAQPQSGDGTTNTQSSESNAPQPDGAGDSAGNRDSSDNPDGEGERDYAPVYAPNVPQVSTNGENASLESSASDSPVRPGDTLTTSDESANAVPYNQVFEAYANQASRALESDYVPLGLQDVIQAYFQNLEP
jgi:hypothetical protein